VVSTERGTTLCENGIIAATVEHGIAAIHAAGIDNCLIEIDAPEFPILDESSAEYTQGQESYKYNHQPLPHKQKRKEKHIWDL